MRVATWNVNGLRARLEFFVHWLRARKPDVVALQELKLADGFPHEALAAEGYRAVVHGQKAWNGVAVVAREELGDLVAVQCGLPGQDAAGARLLTAEVAGLRMTSIYVPNGKTTEHPDFVMKLAWLDALAEHLGDADASRPAIVGGDFNLCPGPLDTWSESLLAGGIFHTDAERTRFHRLESAGLVDLYRHAHPDGTAFSWWDYRAGAFHRGHGLRIDFLLGSTPILSRLRAVEIDRDYRKKKDGLIPSDHAPVIADLAD